MWFRRKPKPDPTQTVRALREQALGVGAAELGLVATTGRAHVWGVLMETGYPEGVATLVALGDGTSSLYFSNGGGIIGGGEHARVRAASDRFLTTAEAYVTEFTNADATPFPGVGRVRFYVRTFEGTLTAEASEDDLGEQRHALSPLFHSGHAVIAAMRELSPG